jgi:Arc/MetJ-type ribon-helix-helix transcriptional regulator
MTDTTIYIPPDLAEKMDRARQKQRPVPSRSAFGRYLIRRAIEDEDPEALGETVVRAAVAGTAEAAARALAQGREVPVPNGVCADADDEG